MATLGFRYPQFSDDVAWLPTWLQPLVRTTPFGNAISDDEIHLDQSLPQMDPFKGNSCQDKDGSIYPGRDRQNSPFHLYLSGEENSSISCNPSSDKVLQLNLHLSTDGSSHVSSPEVGVSHVDRQKSSHSKPVLPVETTLHSKETFQNDTDYKSGHSNLFPQNSEQQPYKKDSDHVFNKTEDNGHKDLQILTPTVFLDAETDTAVELSIAASEALVLHELIQNGVLPAFSAAEILELALRVKEARLEVMEGSCIRLTEEIDNFDVSSDLDDSDMEDAYRDVGLSINDLDNVIVEDSMMSKVKCTPISQQGAVSARRTVSEQQRDLEPYSTNVPSKQHMENNIVTQTPTCNMSAEIPDDEKQEMLSHYHAAKFISSGVSHLDPEFQHASKRHLDNSAKQQVDSTPAASVDMVSHHEASATQPYSREVTGDLIPKASHHENRGEHRTTNRASCNFQSRWFGGWTGEEEKASGGVKSKHMAQYFVGETSFLTESYDVAPDEKSFVNNHHEVSNVSQPSVQLEVLNNTVNLGADDCQDTTKDSSLSPIDPLCSVVPCSISMDSGNSSLAKCNDAEGTTDAYSNLKENSENMVENVQISVDHIDGAGNHEGSDELVSGDVSCRPIVRRQTTSLKAYSMGMQRDHKCMEVSNSNSKKACVPKHNTKLLLCEHPISCINSSAEKDINGPVKSIAIGNIAKDNAENHKASVFGDVSKILTGQKEHDNKTAKDRTELQALHDQQSAPFILRRAYQRRCQAPNPDIGIFSELQHEIVDSDLVAECHHNRHLEGPALPHERPRDPHLPPRKRVRFVDNEPDVQKRKKLRKPTSTSIRTATHKIGSCSGAVERPQQLEIKSQKIKERLTNCLTKHKNSIFQGLDFLLTGLSVRREKELESLLRKHGGTVLSDIPSPSYPRERTSSRFNSHKLAVVLCTKKLLTTKFLYGCAANAFLLKVHWATDSIKRGRLLPPEKYMVLSNQAGRKPHRIGKEVRQSNDEHIFDRVGIMLHGRHSFCSKFSTIIKHGRGRIYKTLQWLLQGVQTKRIYLGVIVVEDGSCAPRHLEKFASEQKIPMLPASWILDCLYQGKLLPFQEKNPSPLLPAVKVPEVSASQEWTQEI